LGNRVFLPALHGLSPKKALREPEFSDHMPVKKIHASLAPFA
jgi:hypothetical protein